MVKPITRQYVSGRISNEVKAIVIFFTFVAAILNISISPTVPQRHEPHSEHIGQIVSKTHLVDSDARSTRKSMFGCRTIAHGFASVSVCDFRHSRVP